MDKILIVYDQPDWVFERMADALRKHCRACRIDKKASYELAHGFDEEYDAVLWLPDWQIDLIERVRPRKEKLILAIRCDVFLHRDARVMKFYKEEDLNRLCSSVAVSNKILHMRFHKRHRNVYYAPGGVDVGKFRPKAGNSEWCPEYVIGWAGSNRNHGEKVRGLDLVKEACRRFGARFYPALRELNCRNIDEMVKYYQDEIDIYVDAHAHAGRQNGLLEAAACGKIVVATHAGISGELIDDGRDGFLCERSAEGIEDALNRAMVSPRRAIAARMRAKVEEQWSWEAQAPRFERMFEETING